MSHIIGRPDDGLLDIMLGDGADPEQAFIRDRQPGPERHHGVDDRPTTEEPDGAPDRRDPSRPS